MKYAQIKTRFFPLNKAIEITAIEMQLSSTKTHDVFKIVLEFVESEAQIQLCKFIAQTKKKSNDYKRILLYDLCEDIADHISYYIAEDHKYVLNLYELAKEKALYWFREFGFKEIENEKNI